MDTERESPEQPAPRRRGLMPIDRRHFGKVAAALGFHAAFGGWYTTLRDGQVPTLERVVAKALAIDKAEAAKPAKYRLRLGTSVSKNTEEEMRFGVWEFAEDIATRSDGEIQIGVLGGASICGEVNCQSS